jgi:hypothetical protein
MECFLQVPLPLLGNKLLFLQFAWVKKMDYY